MRDRERVDRLQVALEQAGISVWRDTANLWPGQDWRIEIRNAILTGSFAFIACFSENSSLKGVTYQNEELNLAVGQMRLLAPGHTWLIPVRFADCSIPAFDLGPGRTLESLQHIDLLDDIWDRGIYRLIGAVMRVVHGGSGLLTEPDAPRSAGVKQRSIRSGAGRRNERITSREVQGSPTVRRRRLATELREIRRSKGMSGEAVAAALGWSPSKLGRYERGRSGLQPQEVERMLDYYEITGARRVLLLALAEDAAQKGWWEELPGVLSADYQQFIGLEQEASSIAIWHVDVVPGLLQTEAYGRHIINSYSGVEPITPAMVERLVKVRMRRQQVLDHEPQLAMSVVLDESVLHRQVGDEQVMYEQLQRLAREADRPNLTLQVLPLRGQHKVFASSFVIFSFGSDDDVMQTVVDTEQLHNVYSLEDERAAHLHKLVFQILTHASLDSASSQEIILKTAESHWSDPRRAR